MSTPLIFDLTWQAGESLGFRLSDDSNTVTRVDPQTPAQRAGLHVGDVIEQVGRSAVRGSGSAARLLKEAKKSESSTTLALQRKEPAALAPGKKAKPARHEQPAAGPAKKAKPAPPEQPAAAAAPAKKAVGSAHSSKPELHPLAAEQEQKRQRLLAKQSKELKALEAKHAAGLAAFECACRQEQTNASGKSACYVCGTHVPGVVEKPKYSFESLPKYADSTCCFCQLARKCPSCKWAVECAYVPEDHHFCEDCEGKANICSECDGGCTKCQDDAGCCRYNGGRGRR